MQPTFLNKVGEILSMLKPKSWPSLYLARYKPNYIMVELMEKILFWISEMQIF